MASRGANETRVWQLWVDQRPGETDPTITVELDDIGCPCIAVHEAVCAERWKQTNSRLARIGSALMFIILLLLVGEGAVIDVLQRLSGL